MGSKTFHRRHVPREYKQRFKMWKILADKKNEPGLITIFYTKNSNDLSGLKLMHARDILLIF